MKKKLVALVLAILSVTTVVNAPVSATNILFENNEDIEMRFEEINTVISNIDITNGKVYSTGSYSVRLDNPKIILTITVQESSNNTSWSNVKSEEYEFATKRGNKTITYNARDKYYYRTKVTVEVYDSNSKFIESTDTYSKSKLCISIS